MQGECGLLWQEGHGTGCGEGEEGKNKKCKEEEKENGSYEEEEGKKIQGRGNMENAKEIKSGKWRKM